MVNFRLQAAFAAAFLSVTLSLIQPSLAIGISPGRIEMDFYLGENMTYPMSVIGGSYERIEVVSRPSERCGLSEYIVPEKTELYLQPGERVVMDVEILLPSEYPRPGLHQCEVIAQEVPLPGYSGIAAFSAVATQVWIRVPYPAKYLEGRLSVQNVNLSETAHFTITLESMGLENVTAGAVITVTDGSGRQVATLQTTNAFIPSMGSGILTASWETAGMPAGRYYAQAAVDYGDDSPLLLRSEFKIGDILVKIVNVTYPSDIFPGQIVKLEVLVDSYWNDRIEGSYITLEMTRNGSSAGSSRSESFDLEPWGSFLVPIYWDTDGLSEGQYDAMFSVHYAGKEESGTLSLEIKQRENPYLILLLLALIAAIAVAAAYAFHRKRRKK